MCSDVGSKAGTVNKMHQQLHRRSFPFEFEWCFPAEPDHQGELKCECARSALPGFEYLCLLSCACVMLMNSAEINRAYGDFLRRNEAVQSLLLLVDTKVRKQLVQLLNAAQWHKIRRAGLPMQLLPSWLAVLAAKAVNMEHNCVVLYT